MTDQRRELEERMQKLRSMRDEIRVQLHLARAEARDDWEELEAKWAKLRARMDMLDNEIGKTSRDVGSAAILLAEEIRNGYHRIRESLKK